MNEKEPEETAAIFVSFYDEVSLSRDISHWQKQLFGTYPEVIDQVIPMWLSSKLFPENVYSMMPIDDEDILTHGVGDRNKWKDISTNLKQWLEYVDQYNKIIIDEINDWEKRWTKAGHTVLGAMY